MMIALFEISVKKAANINFSDAVTKSYAGPINLPETGQDGKRFPVLRLFDSRISNENYHVIFFNLLPL
jgi:hypothetical protein